MKTCSSIAAVLFLALAGPARAADAPKPMAVSFELLKTKHIAVQVKINGKGPYRVIFDTGAPVSLLNNKVARLSGMVAKNARPPFFSLFGSMGPTAINTLELGDLKVKDSGAVVMDHPTVELLSKALGPIEGIVGFPFFARFKMTIDYQAKKMTFVPNGFDPPDAMEVMMTNMMAMADENPHPKVLTPAAQWGLVLHKQKTDEEAGVTVKEVLAGSAAAAGGLKAGDRLLTLDGRWTDNLPDAYLAASYVKPGTAAQVVVKRGGKELQLTVKPRLGL
ncbi:MAG TPA: PDZ domain-containing protein [Gemmataceae bacterium]|jgi:hypothetical protein|nr:PDZ domain-containing protein [Gemmataceae bacterium]